MYVVNTDVIAKESYKCNGVIHKYLNQYLPVLSRDDKFYYYAKTDSFEEAIKNAPFWLRAVIKCKT